MKTSPAGRKAIAKHEGNVLTAYKDSGGVLTIGVGHTSAAGPPKVTAGMKITAKESDEILARDLADVEEAVNRLVKAPISQNQFDALVSLTFNIGEGAFAKSTLLKKLNRGDVAGAADQFRVWNKVKGKVVKGLTTRREAERKMFLATGKPVQSDPKPEAPKPQPAPQTPPTPAPAPRTEPNEFDSILHRGSRGQFVTELQTNLNKLGYGPVMVDGQFGAETETAVVKFQHDHGLKPDGWAGPRTLDAIGKALKDQETAPKIAAASEVVDDAAGKGPSKTEVITTITGVGGVATVVKETVDSVRDGATSLLSLGPWILLALLIAAGAGYVFWERRRKRLMANAVKQVL